MTKPRVSAIFAVPLIFTILGASASAQDLSANLRDAYLECLGRSVATVDGEVSFFDGEVSSMPSPSDLSGLDGISAAKCLSTATGEQWAYDPERKQFGTGIRYGQALAAENRLRQALAEELAEEERRLAEAERKQGLLLLFLETKSACENLYAGNAAEALTNSVCQEVFQNMGGLPPY